MPEPRSSGTRHESVAQSTEPCPLRLPLTLHPHPVRGCLSPIRPGRNSSTLFRRRQRQVKSTRRLMREHDLQRARWAIPGARTKNGRGIVLPLHPLLLPDLEAVLAPSGAGATWRLLGDVAGNGFKGFGKLKQRVDSLSGATGWPFHDLRRTARTGMTRLGVPRDHAEVALNHVSGRSSLERTCDRYDYAPEMIATLARWQAHVASLVTDAPKAEVVALRRP
jgi:integrase